jgi:hypothetical protein
MGRLVVRDTGEGLGPLNAKVRRIAMTCLAGPARDSSARDPRNTRSHAGVLREAPLLGVRPPNLGLRFVTRMAEVVSSPPLRAAENCVLRLMARDGNADDRWGHNHGKTF